MAVFNKINAFMLNMGQGVHDLRAAGDTVKVYLSNALPLATNTIKSDVAEITPQNGYPAGGGDIQNDWTESGGISSLTGVDVVFTATGGPFGPFQYVPMYNETPVSPLDPLMGWWDYGSSISVQDGETFTIDFGASVLQVA